MSNIPLDSKIETTISKTVYYFSGTGNSYYVAKTIAENINAILKPIVLLKSGDVISADLIVFVFPVYDSKPPKKVTEIINHLSLISSTHVIGVCTYGIALAKTLRHFKKTLKQKNIDIANGFGVKMPHCAVGSTAISDRDVISIIAKGNKKIDYIIESINSRTIGDVENTTIFEDMTIIKQLPKVFKILLILIFKGAKALEFTVTSDCISCNQCQKLCPTNNIEMIDGKPKFGKNCTSCFACIQWCPNNAINIGKYSFEEMALKHYHHPQVRVTDLIIDRSSKFENDN